MWVGGVGRVEHAQFDARYRMSIWVWRVVMSWRCRRKRTSGSQVESGRRDGSDCGMRLAGWLAGWWRLASAVVAGRRSRRRDARGKGVAWTRWQLGQVGRQQTSGCTVGGCCCSGSKGAAAESERGFLVWWTSDGAAFRRLPNGATLSAEPTSPCGNQLHHPCRSASCCAPVQ